MSKISVVMPVYNAEKYLSESIESILRQSFEDFELLIIDDGSTDKSIEIIQSYQDTRIRLFQNKHNFIDTLNLGLKEASGKYIARMDADDIMHIDRLRIQHSIMEEEPLITVCGSSMIPFGENTSLGNIYYSGNGLIEYPLLHLLEGNIIFHPTAMIRSDFLHANRINYDDNYPYAEDYKLWFEIAKVKGVFFLESQPLICYRISDNQLSKIKEQEQKKMREKIICEILEHILGANKKEYPELLLIYKQMLSLRDRNRINVNHLSSYFYQIFNYNKDILEKNSLN